MNAMRRGLFRGGFSAFLSIVAGTAFAATTYQVEQLPQFSADYPYAYPSTIGENGAVVGTAYFVNSDTGGTKAIFWNAAGQITDLFPSAFEANAADINSSGQVLLNADYITYIAYQGTLTPLTGGSGNLTGYAINDAGQVTGWFASAGQQRAFLYSNGVATDLGTLPGGTYSYSYDINNHGQVVGLASNSSGQSRAVLWSNGAVVDLGVLPGFAFSVARAINDAGQIVGYSSSGYPSYATRAFLWENGVMTDLGSVGDNDAVTPADINNAGQIVGSARVTGQYRSTAFLWENGSITNLEAVIGNAGGSSCYTAGINDSGQITGICGGQPYRLTPAADAVDVGVSMTIKTSGPSPAYQQVYQDTPLTYVIQVVNTGSLPATNISITDVLPSQMSLVSAASSQGNCVAGAMIRCALSDLDAGAIASVEVNVIATGTGYNITNTVTVTIAEAESNSTNNTAAAIITVREPLRLADMGVTVTALQNPVSRRSNITYIINVKNAGPDIAQQVSLSDTLADNPVSLVSYTVSRGSCVSISGSLSCQLGDMASGETATLTVTVKPRYWWLTFLKYTNSASVSSKTQDNNTANNYAGVTVSVK